MRCPHSTLVLSVPGCHLTGGLVFFLVGGDLPQKCSRADDGKPLTKGHDHRVATVIYFRCPMRPPASGGPGAAAG
jgi:hypothetical protein